jgi:GNAT superfamily N-acetyltransferase
VNTARLTAHDWWYLLREQGPKAALADIGDIAHTPFFTTADQIVVRKELTAAEPGAASTIRIEQAEPDHLPLLAQFNRRQCNTRRTLRFETGLAEGKRALLGFRDGELIGYMWWHDSTQSGDDFYLSRFGFELHDGEMYGYDLFIAPEHRGHGTPVEFLAGVEAELVRLGYRRMYGFVDGSNVPARWLYATSGYEDVLRCKTRTILRRLMRIDGRGWLVSGKDGLRPLTAGRRR